MLQYMEDDTVPFASHIVRRGQTYQYVRRVPLDVVDRIGRKRIQVSLRTRDRNTAYKAAAAQHERWEAEFPAARIANGQEGPTVSTADWTSSDWGEAVEWYRLTRLHEDWQARCRTATGAQIAAGRWTPNDTPERDGAVRVWHREGLVIEGTSLEQYALTRLAKPRAYLRRIGVSLITADARFEEVVLLLQQTDLAIWRTLWERERGESGACPHPDTVAGRWRAPKVTDALLQSSGSTIEASTEPVTATSIGRTLADCFDAWLADRDRVGKATSPSARQDKLRSIEEFGKLLDGKDLCHIMACPMWWVRVQS